MHLVDVGRGYVHWDRVGAGGGPLGIQCKAEIIILVDGLVPKSAVDGLGGDLGLVIVSLLFDSIFAFEMFFILPAHTAPLAIFSFRILSHHPIFKVDEDLRVVPGQMGR